MNFDSLIKTDKHEASLLNRVFAYESMLERKEQELSEDLAYYQGRLLASGTQSAVAEMYREHINDIQILLAELYRDPAFEICQPVATPA